MEEPSKYESINLLKKYLQNASEDQLKKHLENISDVSSEGPSLMEVILGNFVTTNTQVYSDFELSIIFYNENKSKVASLILAA